MASEEGNCLSQCKRFIIRKESTGIKKNYPDCGAGICRQVAEEDMLIAKWFNTLFIKASGKNPI